MMEKKNTNEAKSTARIAELVMILDRSGSMGGLESDTIGGYNETLRRQKEEDGECWVTTVLFDDRYELLHDRVPVREVRPLTGEDYYVRGSTALLDAVGRTIERIALIQEHARPEDRPDRTIFVITTDGLENSSRHYTHRDVKRLIEQHQEKDRWEFLYLGANIDAYEEAAKIGVRAERTANFVPDGKGMRNLHGAVGSIVSAMRSASDEEYEEELTSFVGSVNMDYIERGGKQGKKRR